MYEPAQSRLLCDNTVIRLVALLHLRRDGHFIWRSLCRNNHSFSAPPPPAPTLSNVLCSHVLPVKLALSPEQRLSETTCSSVPCDYLLCSRRCQIIKHLRPLSPCSQSPRGSLLLRLDVWLYKAAFQMSHCDSPLRVSLTTRTTGQYFSSKLLHTSNLYPPQKRDFPLPPPPFHLRNIDDHQSGSDTVNNEK